MMPQKGAFPMVPLHLVEYVCSFARIKYPTLNHCSKCVQNIRWWPTNSIKPGCLEHSFLFARNVRGGKKRFSPQGCRCGNAQSFPSQNDCKVSKNVGGSFIKVSAGLPASRHSTFRATCWTEAGHLKCIGNLQLYLGVQWEKKNVKEDKTACTFAQSCTVTECSHKKQKWIPI